MATTFRSEEETRKLLARSLGVEFNKEAVRGGGKVLVVSHSQFHANTMDKVREEQARTYSRYMESHPLSAEEQKVREELLRRDREAERRKRNPFLS